MTEQEEMQYLFDKSFRHILKQGKPSVGPYQTCLYRHPDGLCCAAEPFISEYDSAMEGKLFKGLIRQWPEKLDPISVNHPGFMSRLQSAHDDAAIHEGDFIDSYRLLMKGIAESYKLTYREPND